MPCSRSFMLHRSSAESLLSSDLGVRAASTFIAKITRTPASRGSKTGVGTSLGVGLGGLVLARDSEGHSQGGGVAACDVPALRCGRTGPGLHQLGRVAKTAQDRCKAAMFVQCKIAFVRRTNNRSYNEMCLVSLVLQRAPPALQDVSSLNLAASSEAAFFGASTQARKPCGFWTTLQILSNGELHARWRSQ